MDDLSEHTVGRIEVTLNGRSRSISTGSTVSELIQHLELQDRLVVVERNGEIVARGEFPSTILGDGDVLEIVHFVGGG